ncbi:hypothetical protein PEX2_066720 [Penicillium expansum]|uniref:NACHT-NTPase and P-loop NTPases N-terminal domain-containing protein n=1 Tax=Penicillium expansum TaxID=27334 RepID=A0A0A2JRZ2_PENEN|nr:hypothetical protein PEX2_066720 [Penicillium expansum]KGO58162.1 hypothetical protein PEX2_066720 [Penicillium expansum]
MADPLTVVGAVASTIQLIEFTAKVFDRLNNYIRHIDEVPETLRQIKLHLPLFIETLQRVQTFIDFGYFNPRTSSVLKDFVEESFSQMVLLDDLLLKIIPDKGDSVIKKGRKAIFSLKEESSLKKIFENISGYIEKLLLFQSSVTSGHAMIHTQSLLKMHQSHTAYGSLVPGSPIPTDARAMGYTSEPVMKLDGDARLKSISNYSKRGKDRRISYFLSLSRFGLLWALQVDLNISWGNKAVSILPGLHFQQLVKNTSPGLEIFMRCMMQKMDTESASQALIGLFRRGVVSPHDVFPDGATWLESFANAGHEWGHRYPGTVGDSSLNSSAYTELSLGNADVDPFLLQFLAECSKNAYDEIERLVQDPRSLRGTNLLRQNPVHVAVLRPNALAIIVRVFGDLDMPDLAGKTPLEYAAAYGSTESILILLKSGARPWELLSEAVAFFRNKKTFSESFVQHQLKDLMLETMHTGDWNSNIIHIFLGLGVDPRIVSRDGDTLLYFADSAANVDALFPTASEYINDTNNDGWTALMTSIGNRPLEVSKAIVHRGCNINHQDTMGLSALHIASELITRSVKSVPNKPDYESIRSISTIFAVIAMLIAEDADPFSRDKCRCACSDGGCSPITLMLDRIPSIHKSHYLEPSGYLWVLEWLLTLSDLRGEAIARKALLDLIRFKEFQKAELTHVCISDHEPNFGDYFDGDEIDEIMDEEKELIWQLEETMEKWKQKIDYLPIEEAWLDMLNEFCPVNYKPPMVGPWWSSFVGTNYDKSEQAALPSFIISAPNPTGSSFYVDKISDVYRSHEFFPVDPSIAASPRAYIAWVESIYRYGASDDYPIEINYEWYEKRKYWANRQFEVLRDCGIFEIPQ